MDLTVIIPTRNRPEQAQRRVEELKDTGCEVIVVDDASQRPVIVNGARILRNPQRLGSSESRNAGSRQANRNWLLLMDDDIVPSPVLARFIEELLPKLRHEDVIGFRITGFANMGSSNVRLYQDTLGSRILNILFGVDISRHGGPSRFIPGAMIIRSDFFASLGGFDSRMFGGNGFREESDLQLRAREKGGRLTYFHDPFFRHLNASGGHEKSRYSDNDIYYMRNQTIFALRSRSPASLVMIAAFGSYMLARGFRVSILVKGVARGMADVLRD